MIEIPNQTLARSAPGLIGQGLNKSGMPSRIPLVGAFYRYADMLTQFVFRTRLCWYLRIRRSLRTAESQNAFDATVPHNLKSIGAINSRMRHLIKPLAGMENITPASSVLVIGPRNEWDLCLLRKEGFHNVTGLDLISYSPLIQIGDMHDLATACAGKTFDCVLCGWTLSYSATPQLAAESILSVVKDGGIVGLAVEYYAGDAIADDAWKQKNGYVIQERGRLQRRINSVAEILSLFGNAVGHVFWQHDAPLRQSHGAGVECPNPSAVAVLFDVKKT
jgi:hypothetical protein